MGLADYEALPGDSKLIPYSRQTEHFRKCLSSTGLARTGVVLRRLAEGGLEDGRGHYARVVSPLQLLEPEPALGMSLHETGVQLLSR